MNAIIAWFISGPIGTALVDLVMKKINERFDAITRENAELKANQNQMAIDMQKFKALNDQSSMKEQEDAADDVFEHF